MQNSMVGRGGGMKNISFGGKWRKEENCIKNGEKGLKMYIFWVMNSKMDLKGAGGGGNMIKTHNIYP